MRYVLNFKSNFTKESILAYKEALEKHPKKDNVIFAPPFCFLPLLEGYSLASQDISRYQEGAYTGEVSGNALKSLGVRCAIIGHSERRKYLKEDEVVFAKQIEQAIASGITPIYCIGETKEEHDSGRTLEALEGQLSFLFTFPQEMWKKVIVAYEPIWAIGTGKAITPNELEKIIAFLKEKIEVPLLYGGSINSSNLEQFKTLPHLDGFLIGGMSLKIEEVLSLLQES